MNILKTGDTVRGEIQDAVQGYVVHLLSMDNLQDIVPAVQPGYVDVLSVESDMDSFIIHIFENTQLEILLCHHHKKEENDIMRFSCANFADNKVVTFEEMGGVTVEGVRNGQEADIIGRAELANSKQRLKTAINDLRQLELTKENACYNRGLCITDITPLASYTSLTP
jgi:hypothetical protein